MEFDSFRSPSQYLAKINADSFNDIALSVFRYQYENNNIYARYTDAIGVLPGMVKTTDAIPFLPISFFKTHAVVSGKLAPEYATTVFESSGTTGELTSRHYIFRPELYEDSLLAGFRQFYGNPDGMAILALLPSYLERKNASLVYMAQTLMQLSGHPANGFYLNEWEQLANTLRQLQDTGTRVLLLGVTFALLDFAAAYPMDLNKVIVMETGGMKGRRAEWTRQQVHQFLKDQWNLPAVASEYGMTELLSQAYALENGVFRPSATMNVLVRDINDPLETSPAGSGCLNIIDLANLDTCAFIATEDLGRVRPDGSFEVLGRMDHAALRGCSLMAV